MPPSASKPMPEKRTYPVFKLLFVLGILAALFFNRQNIFDWYKLRDYTAPSVVAQLATEDTMTSYGRKIFYVNHPLIEDKAAFITACPNNGGEKTIILGCYKSWQDGVYILSVDDPVLDGVEQVTAAHEMLHAGYDRLSLSDRTRVDSLLLNYYNTKLKDDRIKQIINSYKKSEPNDLVNEMHSIFGTEVTNLPPALETYYSKYFTNRKRVAEYSNSYLVAFTSRSDQIKKYDSELADIQSEVDNLKSDLKSQYSQITAKQQEMQSLKRSNQYSAYNAEVPVYNQMVDSYNSEVKQLQNLIAEYNQIVSERNSIALEEQQLNNDLNANIPSTINN